MNNFHPDGIGELLGDSLVTAEPLLTSGSIWYVHHDGADASSPAGRDKQNPLATLAQAVSNASDHDIIALLPGHTETITSTVGITQPLMVLGCGSNGGLPSVRLTHDMSSGAVIQIHSNAATFVDVRNIYFVQGQQAHNGYKIQLGSEGGLPDHTRIVGCYFEQGQHDGGAAVFAADLSVIELEGNRYVVVSESGQGAPGPAVELESSAADMVSMRGEVFDGGATGFDAGMAADLRSLSTDVLRAEGLSLLRGADMHVSEDAVGYINVQKSTGGARVIFEDP